MEEDTAPDPPKPPLKDRLSGLGLSEMVRRERLELRKQKKRDYEKRRANRQVSEVEPPGPETTGAPQDRSTAQHPTASEEPAIKTSELESRHLGHRQDDDSRDSPDEHPGKVIAEITAAGDAGEAGDPDQMAARLYRAFAGQMDRLEARLKEILPDGAANGSAADLAEIDKTVKTLASLAKTLTVLTGLKTDGSEEAGSGDEDTGTESLRAALAQRLERLGSGGAD